MSSKYLILLFPMISGVIYHLTQKSIRPGLSPFLVYSVVYFLAMVLMLAIGLSTQKSLGSSLSSLSFSDYKTMGLVALGVSGIELSFLYVYRSGLPVSYSSLLVNIGVGIILLVTGLLFFSESLSIKQYIGVAFCLLGMILIKA